MVGQCNGHYDWTYAGAAYRSSGTPKDGRSPLLDFEWYESQAGLFFRGVPIVEMEVSSRWQNLFDAYQDDFDKGPGRDSALYLWTIIATQLFCPASAELIDMQSRSGHSESWVTTFRY